MFIPAGLCHWLILDLIEALMRRFGGEPSHLY
jgi:hypothetical protein